MGAKSKSKSKSKKGPKGKKARAKAKLEQVWGEQYNEDERKASRLRAGKSRLLLDKKKGNRHSEQIKEFDPLSKNRRGIASTFESFLDRKKKYNDDEGNGRLMGRNTRCPVQKEKERDDFASSDEDSSGDESNIDGTRDEISGGMNGGGSLASLLNRITGPHASNKNITTDDEEEDEEIDDEDVESSVEDAMDSNVESETDIQHFEAETLAENDDARQIVDTEMKSCVVDPYEAHFSKSTLEQPESLQSSTTKSRLVPTRPFLKSSLEVQISGRLLNTWECALTCIVDSSGGHPDKSSEKKMNGIQTKKAWEEFASGPYQYVRKALTSNWRSVNTSVWKHTDNGSIRNVFSALQMTMYPAVSRYADVLITSESRQNRDEINTLLSLHVLNHVLTSRTRVQRHNRRIKELINNADCDDSPSGAFDDKGDDKWRDQGYTRPKVLILLPTRGTCWSFLKQMIQLLGDAAIVDNGDRFDKEFGPLENDEENNSEDEDATAKARRLAVLKQKGEEWNDLFSDDTNADDDFMMGISVTPNFVKKSAGTKKKKNENAGEGTSGVNVKLFAEFYHSDIIVASPIGLKMSISRNNDGGDDDDEDEVEADVDFLSSIDVCLIVRSDVLLMQNWDHVNSVLDSLNKQPKKISDIDFARVRNYFLDGHGTRWRQLVIVSQFTDPHILSTFRRYAKNVEGQLKIRQRVPSEGASICNVMVHVKKVFQRVACQTVSEAGENRLRYFSDHILPKLMRLKQKHTLIFVPSYFDFIAVRNLLIKREADFCCVTEYSRVSEVSRGRARFLQGRKAIMLYTGRAHFFLRHYIKGARHVLFFGLPDYADFFPAVVNMLNEGLSHTEEDGDGISRMPLSCLSLYTKFDAHPLERIVGTSHADRMIRGEKSSYLFSS